MNVTLLDEFTDQGQVSVVAPPHGHDCEILMTALSDAAHRDPESLHSWAGRAEEGQTGL